jgi:hypothetical protein
MRAGGGDRPFGVSAKAARELARSGRAKVLREVADKSGWGKSLPEGMGQGIAIANWA